jgi:hypothetical protein
VTDSPTAANTIAAVIASAFVRTPRAEVRDRVERDSAVRAARDVGSDLWGWSGAGRRADATPPDLMARTFHHDHRQ